MSFSKEEFMGEVQKYPVIYGENEIDLQRSPETSPTLESPVQSTEHPYPEPTPPNNQVK